MQHVEKYFTLRLFRILITYERLQRVRKYETLSKARLSFNNEL